MPWWHVGFGVVVLATGAWAAADLPAGWRFGVTLGLYAMLAGLYAATLHKFSDGNGKLIYLAGAGAIFAAATFVFPGSGFLLFVLVPHCFMVLPLRAGASAMVGLVVISAGSQLVWDGANASTAEALGASGAFSLALSFLLGGYIARIIDQSAQRAALIDELEHTAAELAELSRSNGAREERERLVREIHDALAQGFTSVVMVVQAARAALERNDAEGVARHLGLAESAAREGLAEARGLMEALAPLPLQGADLAGAVERVCREVGYRFGFTGRFETRGEPCPLSRNAEIVFLRAAQVALVNVGRHSGSGEAIVSLSFSSGSASLTVEDRGTGFELGGAGGFGLAQLRARVAEVAGTVEVVSSVGEGTKVRVVLPAGSPPFGDGEAQPPS